ncbi:hypothetical protein ACH4S8_41560 [Streptomyces sp. NPDC021080]|uniref:hypothetical protein n=1 Tax=Streptomyces sp. NPDC021080 TaxID=3365110 RepID=UPI0037AE6AFB
MADVRATRLKSRQLRAISTRAEITATNFTNTYEWGDLSGDPRRMVARYFDAHPYVTNWGTHRLMLRLPRQALNLSMPQAYCLGRHVEVWTARTHLRLHTEYANPRFDAQWSRSVVALTDATYSVP